MHVGFNHNIRYKDHIYHVQTEDCGRKKGYLVTLLYRGGHILGSKKVSYADVLESDEVELVVEELMKVQHKDMMRRLTSGEFDQKIAAFDEPIDKAQPVPTPAATAAEPVAPATSDPDLDALILAYLTGGDQQ